MKTLEDELASYLIEHLRDQGIQIIKLPRLLGLIEAKVIENMAWEAYTKAHLAEMVGMTRTNIQWKLRRYAIKTLDKANKQKRAKK